MTLLQRKPGKLGAGLGKTTGWIHRAALHHKRVEMIAGVNYERIGPDGLFVTHGPERKDGQLIACDTVVLWGVSDAHSWIPGFRPGWGAALLLDEQYQPKPAYDAVAALLADPPALPAPTTTVPASPTTVAPVFSARRLPTTRA